MNILLHHSCKCIKWIKIFCAKKRSQNWALVFCMRSLHCKSTQSNELPRVAWHVWYCGLVKRKMVNTQSMFSWDSCANMYVSNVILTHSSSYIYSLLSENQNIIVSSSRCWKTFMFIHRAGNNDVCYRWYAIDRSQ